MELVLKIDGKDKTFVAPFISGRMLRRTVQITKQTDFNDMSEESLDTVVDYIVEIYGKQFTRDEFYDGIESKKLFPTVINCIHEAGGQTSTSGSAPADPNS